LTGFLLHLDVNTVDNALSFRLRAGFSIGSIQTGSSDAGEIARMVKDISIPIYLFPGFPLDDRRIASTLDEMLSQTTDRQLDSDAIDNL
jgi:hypothetical protein